MSVLIVGLSCDADVDSDSIRTVLINQSDLKSFLPDAERHSRRSITLINPDSQALPLPIPHSRQPSPSHDKKTREPNRSGLSILIRLSMIPVGTWDAAATPYCLVTEVEKPSHFRSRGNNAFLSTRVRNNRSIPSNPGASGRCCLHKRLVSFLN